MAARVADRDLRLEAGGALTPTLPRAHGVSRAEVRAALTTLGPAIRELLGPRAPSGFLALPLRRTMQREILAAARRWRERGVRDVIHVGIGGSSLGAETLFRALAHPFHNELPLRKRRAPRAHFVDNVDPETLAALLDVVDLDRSVIHVVSKSGSTVETAAGFQTLRRLLGRGARLARHCIFTTGDGGLAQLAQREGVEVLAFPEDVGGRYSVLSGSGLLTPALAGVDVAGVMAGARRYRARIEKAAPSRNPSAVAAAIAFRLAERRGKGLQVLMPYADALEPLSRWFVQLLGESLGKTRKRGRRVEAVGQTPLAARGTTDQHSQVQLFVEGPADKLVVFLVPERSRQEVRIGGGEPARYLEGIGLGRLLRAEQRGTEVALARAGRPTLSWRIRRVDAHSMGQLFLALELQTALQAVLYGIDAYDQPGVEAGKVAAFALLGRKGYEAERAAIERLRIPRWTV
ncbi:MAG: glucose-6-phosphate isomerase [Myxococcota bacterium]